MSKYHLLPDQPFRSYREYLDHHGGEPIGAWLAQRAPRAILEELGRSGLRGRGGAGFPTGLKWRTLAQHPCRERSVVCNAAEGEPGTFKDRWLLRHNPYACLEGLQIAAHAIEAGSILIGIKAIFETEIRRLEEAIEEMRSSREPWSEVQIVAGPKEYLFGEEKAMLRFIDDGVPLPREAEYPPYEYGLNATPLSPNPALMNNVETFSHAASIARHGADGFRKLGTEDTPGTILATVCGDVVRPGVYEVEAGTPLREILEVQARGPSRGDIQAVLSGVSQAVIVPDKLDTPADFGSLALAGSGLGSAGFIVVGGGRSIPQVTRDVARFLYVESCNQCSACTHGLRLASSAIDELFDPSLATEDDIGRALYGARSAPQGNRCYLPVQGSLVIPSLISRFRDQFDNQLQKPEPPVDPFPFPALLDYDPVRHVFLVDESMYRKQPDWSYAVGEDAASAEEDPVPQAVRLSADVAAQLRDRALASQVSLDRLVDRILRDALND
ncbi:MAG: NADH-ubiquinone oxidoreductase-F iron-sulfur binding region domain-containing protein [Planctomycetota bacterium]